MKILPSPAIDLEPAGQVVGWRQTLDDPNRKFSTTVDLMKSAVLALLFLVTTLLPMVGFSGDGSEFDLSDAITVELEPRFPGVSEAFTIRITHEACRFLLSDPTFTDPDPQQTSSLTMVATDLGVGPCTPQTQTLFVFRPNGVETDFVADIYVDFPTQGLVLQDSIIFDIDSIYLIGPDLEIQFSPESLQPNEPFDLRVLYGPQRAFRLLEPDLTIEGRRLLLRFRGEVIIGGAFGTVELGPIPVTGVNPGRYLVDIEVDYEGVGVVPVRTILFGVGATSIPSLSPLGVLMLVFLISAVAAARIGKNSACP